MIVFGRCAIHDLFLEHIHEGQQDGGADAQHEHPDKPAALCCGKGHEWCEYNVRPEGPNSCQKQHENPNVRHVHCLQSLKSSLAMTDSMVNAFNSLVSFAI